MKIAKHKMVAIEYLLTDETGQELDRSGDDGPVTYVHGMSEIIPGLERALEGHQAGDHFQVTVPPEDAYGEWLEELCVDVPKAEFEDYDELEIGMQFTMSDDDDEELLVTVVELDDESVTVDGNHPLAGATLSFDVTVCDVRDATPEEIEQGSSHHCCGDHDCCE
jgi:FKBP-type peptidyl-prolyl cis-trans isomerase SlyD